MNLWKYKYFVDVVECKSFTKAGMKNYVTQTAISQQISCLEKTIGEKLLERGNGEIRLTEYGKIVYKRAKEMIQINDQMLREIKNLKEKDVLKIGIDNSINKRFWRKMQEVIDGYYSEEDFQFQKINMNIASKLMEDGELDIYIGYQLDFFGELSEIEEVDIAKNRVGVHFGNDTTLPEKEVLELEDLEGYVRYGTKIYPCSIQENAVKKCDLLVKDTEFVSNIDTMKMKAELNDGYMFADSYYFSYAEGGIRLISDYDEECVLKAFYRKNDPKIYKFMVIMEKVLRGK